MRGHLPAKRPGIAGGPAPRSAAGLTGEPAHPPAPVDSSAARLQPLVATLTPEQQTCLSSIARPNPHLLLAHFRAVPESRPAIHLLDHTLRHGPRIGPSVEYIATLISRYILHQEYYHLYEKLLPPRDRDVYCVFDVGDITTDGPMLVGYGSNGPQMTLIPDVSFFMQRGYFRQREELQKYWLSWRDRARVVFWRGSSTGGGILTEESVPNLPRYRLCAAGAAGTSLHAVLDAKLTNIVHTKGVDEEQRIRAFVESRGLLAAPVPQIEFLKYRFQIDIDGNSNSWGLFLKLLMGSCVLKVISEWRQWYYDKLQPWVHYVPVKNDLSDLEEQVAWCLDHDAEAEEIGARGRELTSRVVLGTELPQAGKAILRATFGRVDGMPAGHFGVEMLALKPPQTTKNKTSTDKQISKNVVRATMYLMTAHGTFVGVDDKLNLIQLHYSPTNLPRLVRIEKNEDGNFQADAAMAGYEIGECTEGVFFAKNQKFLCALPNSIALVTDRNARKIWETFFPVAADFLPALQDNIRRFANANRSPELERERFRQVVVKLVRDGKPVKLYCGAGPVPRVGFLNLDIVAMAPRFFASNPEEYFIFPFAEGRWPLPDDCVDYIFHEDFIEHLPQLKQIQFLAEALRVMKPGSWHRVNTPNLITSMKRFSKFSEGFTGVYTGEEKFGHISIFSPLALKEIAELVGYREIVFTARNRGLSRYAERDFRPGPDRDEVEGNIFADLLK
jgi:Glycosyl transferase family 90